MGKESFDKWLAGSQSARIGKTNAKWLAFSEGFRQFLCRQAGLPPDAYLTPLGELTAEQRTALRKTALRVGDLAEKAREILASTSMLP